VRSNNRTQQTKIFIDPAMEDRAIVSAGMQVQMRTRLRRARGSEICAKIQIENKER
jgi:hypothetical protein